MVIFYGCDFWAFQQSKLLFCFLTSRHLPMLDSDFMIFNISFKDKEHDCGVVDCLVRIYGSWTPSFFRVQWWSTPDTKTKRKKHFHDEPDQGKKELDHYCKYLRVKSPSTALAASQSAAYLPSRYARSLENPYGSLSLQYVLVFVQRCAINPCNNSGSPLLTKPEMLGT